jgi:hypothetical protein
MMLSLLEEKYALKMAWKLGRGEDVHAGMVFSDRKGTFHTLKACITIRQIWQVLFIKNIYD